MIDVGKLWEIVIAVLLAAAGGLARLLNAKDDTALRWSRIFSELFISAFAGLMVLLFARSFGLAGDWLGMVCGMAGWIGPRILDYLTKPTMKSVGINTDEVE